MKECKKEINWYEQTKERNYYIDLEYQGRIWVTKEMYQRLMRDDWNEWKRKERMSRCQISNGKGGVKRCEGNCDSCNYLRSGQMISLDELNEKYELELVDSSPTIIDQINEKERNDALETAIRELDSTDQEIIKMFSLGYSEREIAKELQLPRTTISYRKKDIIKNLREKLQHLIG